MMATWLTIGFLKNLTLALPAVVLTAVLALAACGPAAEPAPGEAQATAAPTATETTTAAVSDATPADAGGAAPSGKLAPTFELPNAAGETVSLASYADDKNVVLVFYRGFW